MEVIEAKVLTGCANIVYTACKRLGNAFQLLPWLDLALWAILVDVIGDRDGNMELVRVGVWGLSLLELENMPRANLKVLLCLE